MRIDHVYDRIVYILRKERNGFVSIDDFNLIATLANIDVFNDYYSSIPKGQKTHDALSPFKAKYNFTPVLSPAGVVTLPAEYAHLISGYTTVSGSQRPIIFPEEDELPYALTSALRPVSINYPLGDETELGVIQLYPEQGQTGRIWYYEQPNGDDGDENPTYAFTLNGRTITYDAANSVQFKFSETYITKIIAKCLTYFGVNLSDQQVLQYGLLKDKESE